MRTYESYHRLGGPQVAVDDVVSEIKRLPLDGILGILGLISVAAFRPTLASVGSSAHHFFDPRFQAYWLNRAIADGFPAALPRAGSMVVPEHVPRTGGSGILLHEQNMAWLAHNALLHARDNEVTPELDEPLKTRVSRLLLIINDFLGTEREVNFDDLPACRNVALEWLRHWHFNRFFETAQETVCRLAREEVILLESLPALFDADRAFARAREGMTLRAFIYIMGFLVSHFWHGMKKSHWLRKRVEVRGMKAHAEDLAGVIEGWTRTPAAYRTAWAQWQQDARRPDRAAPEHDFTPLRQTPLIEARPGQIVCPVLALLLAKMNNEPYYVLSEHLSDSERGEFQGGLGKAYEEYAHALVDRLGAADEDTWTVRRSPSTRDGIELCDSYMQRGTTGVAFEHKGIRPGIGFLLGTEGNRVLGPPPSLLSRIMRGEPVRLRQGKSADEGLLTLGMWQQSHAAALLREWARSEIGVAPSVIYPIITHWSEFHVDQTVRRIYLEPLVKHAGLYRDEFWARPQWLHVTDLEALASHAEETNFDLAHLLGDKNARRPAQRFDLYLSAAFGGKVLDRRLCERGKDILQRALAAFSGGSSGDDEAGLTCSGGDCRQ